MGENQVAGFWIRLGANLLDGLIVSIFMVAMREDKRSLHDFIAGTEVVYD